MDILDSFFRNNLGAVFLIYGLAFFVMGLMIFAQPVSGSRFKLAKTLRQLAWFGVFHGVYEWLDGGAQLYGRQALLDMLSLGMLVVAYLFLFEFGRHLFRIQSRRYPSGLRMIAGPLTQNLSSILIVFIGTAAFFSVDPWRTGMTWTRYLLGFPGSMLTAAGFFCYYKYSKGPLTVLKVKKYFVAGGLAFLLYGILAGMLIPRGFPGPWQWLKMELFFSGIGIPLQMFRAVCACVAGWAAIGILKSLSLATIRDLEEEIARGKRFQMEREWLNNELVRLNEKLAVLDKRKSDFVAMVSHEFKGPLGVLQEALRLLREGHGGDLSPQHQELLEPMDRSVSRLIRLVSGVLDISRIEAGKVELKRELVDLPVLIDEVLVLFRKNITDKQIMLEKSIAPGNGVLWADRDQLSQVLINLLSNAIKYTPSGGRVRIAVSGTENEVCFEISDTGPGIPKEYLEKIFDKFERISVKRQEGTGLGLFITKGIIELHRGRIWVESELGKGSQFRFVLPRNFRPQTIFPRGSTPEGEPLKGAVCDSLE